MNIYYTNNTLYINIDEYLTENGVDKMKKRVFGILNDYDIENIVLNVISNNNTILIDEFINEYHKKYNGNLIVK